MVSTSRPTSRWSGQRFVWTVLAAALAVACSPESLPDASETPTSSTSAAANGRRVGGLLITGDDGAVYIVSRDGNLIHTVSEGTADSSTSISVQPTPSLDSSMIAYTADVESDDASRLWSTVETRAVTPGFAPFFYHWSPGGRRLVSLGNDPGGGVGARIVELPERSITDLGPARPHFLAWSPDGRWLAAHRNARELVVIDAHAATEAPMVLSVNTAAFQSPDWLDPSTVVAAVTTSTIEASIESSPLPAAAEIVAIPIDGGGTTTLAPAGAFNAFAVSPDRQRLALLTGSVAPVLVGRLDVIHLATGDRQTVDDGTVATFQWSPDSTRLLFAAVGGDGRLSPGVWDGSGITTFPAYRPTPVFVEQYLPFWGQYVRHDQPWSPESDAFAYARVGDDGSAEVVVQDLDDMQPVRVTSGHHVTWLQ